MTKYRIVVETGCDIPQDIQNKYNIATVPMHVMLGSSSYDDGTIPVDEMFSYYEKTGELPKTSGSSPADFEKVLDEVHVADPDAHIVHLAYSAFTTCSYNSAVSASLNRDYVTSFDTKSCSGGQSLVVESIAKLIEQKPDLSMAGLKKAIADRVNRIRVGVIPDDIAYLRAGGRVSNAAYFGTQILKLKPLIEIIDGRLIATKKYRGSMMQIVEKFLQSWPEKNRLSKDELFLLFSPGLDDEIKEMAESTVSKMGFQKTRWVQTGCVVSAHTGPGAFGIAGFSEA